MTDTNARLPAPVDNHSRPARPRTWPLWLLLLITLALAIALSLWSWQQWQTQQSMADSLADLQQDTEALEQNQGQRDNEQASRLRSMQQSLSEQRELIATQQRQIDHNARELLEAGNRTRTDWLLAEAEYLLRIGNQRLQIEKDIRGALAALQEADEVLRQTDDVGAYPVRQQIAREIMTLRSIEAVDRTGLYLRLEAAIDAVNQLTDKALANQGLAAPSDSAANDPSTDTGDRGWLATAWDKVTDTLARVVVVRRLDEPVKPLMSPDQSAYARLNMQLMLEEAALAVLRGEQALYQRALDKATRSLDQWYDDSDPRISALEESLGELSGLDIDPELPDISRSLELLKARLEGRLSSDQPSGDSAGDSNAGGSDES